MIHSEPPHSFRRDSGVEETPRRLVHRGRFAYPAGTQDELKSSWCLRITDAIREAAGERAFSGSGEDVGHGSRPMPGVLLGEHPPQVLRARPPGSHGSTPQVALRRA